MSTSFKRSMFDRSTTPGACLDAGYLERTFGIQTSARKDPSQRGACRCMASKDIGMYDTCPRGCAYCYAATDFERARRRRAVHDSQSASLAAEG